MSKQVSCATALALLIGVSTLSLNTALAQNGGEARSTDRAQQKKLDDRELTPVRPIRRVGEENWPDAKDQPAPAHDTTGQSAKKDEKKEEPAKQDAKQEAPKQEPVKQEAAKDTPKQDAAKPEQKQDTAKQDAAKPDVKPQDSVQTKDTGQTKDAAQNKEPEKKAEKGFASIRLGTDERGHVAVNEAQERQITSALRKQHVDSIDVKVNVGSVAPANVRLVTVSSNIVDVLPQFRGYNYFATREEIVIVEPSSKKVVAMIPVKLTATASRPNEERAPAQTETRRAETPHNDTKTSTKTATRERNGTVGRGIGGDGFPTREEILAAPVTRGPAGTAVTRSYRGYQYYEPDNDVVIIERRRPRYFGFW